MFYFLNYILFRFVRIFSFFKNIVRAQLYGLFLKLHFIRQSTVCQNFQFFKNIVRAQLYILFLKLHFIRQRCQDFQIFKNIVRAQLYIFFLKLHFIHQSGLSGFSVFFKTLAGHNCMFYFLNYILFARVVCQDFQFF